DLDLIFVYDPGDAAWWSGRAVPHEFFTRIAERTISALATPTREGIAYRIDTRLRPSGNQGPLVSSLEAFAAYHRSGARLWERQALIKARVVAGAPALGARLEAIVAEFVYGRGLSPAEVAEIAGVRARIERERGAADEQAVNIKTGRGGLVDVEFLVQMLQLRHGQAHPAVRVRDTPGAITALAAAGLLPPADARALAEGYAFLRAPAASGYLFPMEKTERIWLDGKLVPWEAAQVHVLTHTLHYGLGVFEGIRCYQCHDGRSAVFRLREHIDRLYGSAHVLELAMPYPRERLVEACLETVRANRLRECYLRPIVFMGDGEMGLAARPAT